MRILITLCTAILFVFTGTAFSLDLKHDTYTLVYNVFVNGHDKGLVMINKTPEGFSSSYYNLTEGDKIPFYCQTKAGSIEDGIYATHLTFGQEGYRVYNDPSAIPQEVKNHMSGISRQDKSVLVDDKSPELPKLFFDAIPLVTIENIILGFIQGQQDLMGDMLLYEANNKINLRVAIKAQGNPLRTNNSFDGPLTWYGCFRKGLPGQTPKRLFSMAVSNTGIPAAISSNTGRWTVEFVKAGKMVERSYPIRQEFQEVARQGLAKVFTSGKPMITQDAFQASSYYYDYSCDISFPALPQEELIRRHMKKRYLKDGQACTLKQKSLKESQSGTYFITADTAAICKDLRRKDASVEQDCKYRRKRWTDEVYSNTFKATLKKLTGQTLCYEKSGAFGKSWTLFTGPECSKKVDMTSAATTYLTDRHKNLHQLSINDVDITTGTAGHPLIRIDYTWSDPVTNKEWTQAAARVIANQISRNPSDSLVSRVQKDLIRGSDYYAIQITKRDLKAVQEAINRAEYSTLKAKSGATDIEPIGPQQFRFSGSRTIPVKEMYAALEKRLTRLYPDLTYRTHTIKRSDDTWSFTSVESKINKL